MTPVMTLCRHAILSCCPQDHPSPTPSAKSQMPCFHKQKNMCHNCAHMHMDTHKVTSVYAWNNVYN